MNIKRRARHSLVAEQIRQRFLRNPLLKLAAINLEMPVTPGDVMIDCGANVGDVTSLLARSGAKVFAFEPNPLCFEILKRRFRMSPMVSCINKGVMDRHCVLTLRTPGAHERWDAIETTISASFFQEAMAPDRYDVSRTEVECVDLAEFIAALNKPVKLLKLDIEGSELPILNRLIDTGTIEQIGLVIVETHERLMPPLMYPIQALRDRIKHEGLESKIRLDWY